MSLKSGCKILSNSETRQLIRTRNRSTSKPQAGMQPTERPTFLSDRESLEKHFTSPRSGQVKTEITNTRAAMKLAILVLVVFTITTMLITCPPTRGLAAAAEAAEVASRDRPAPEGSREPRGGTAAETLRRARRAAHAPSLASSSIMHPSAGWPVAAALVEPLRLGGSRSEPPSRPTVEWSKQQPKFGSDIQLNVSVELGKTALLSCKVYELGDKTVSWLRGDNEILTSGRFTYIRDPRFSSINDQGSHEWKLEIKDVNLNDSTQYECQVSTDPKMSAVISLHVKAAKARIRQGEYLYAPSGSKVEFTCDLQQRHHSLANLQALRPSSQTYWYHNGNLINYLRVATGEPETAEGATIDAAGSLRRPPNQMATKTNFSIDWDQKGLVSRLIITNVQPYDSGNYTCRPSAAEPATIRLHVKRNNHQRTKDHRANGTGSLQLRERPQNGQLLPAEHIGHSASAAVNSKQVPRALGQLAIISLVIIFGYLWSTNSTPNKQP